MQKKILTSLVSIVLFLAATLQADNAGGETPQQGLKAILELYRAENWEGLVKERCLDTRYAASEAAAQELVASLSAQFKEEGTLEALVSSYESALANEPRIESEGSVAIFSSEAGSVKLSKMENGTWGLRF